MDIETIVRHNSIEYKYQCDIPRVCFVDASKYCTMSLSCGSASNLLMIMACMSSWVKKRCENRLNNSRGCRYNIWAQTEHENQSGAVDSFSKYKWVQYINPSFTFSSGWFVLKHLKECKRFLLDNPQTATPSKQAFSPTIASPTDTHRKAYIYLRLFFIPITADASHEIGTTLRSAIPWKWCNQWRILLP